MSNRSAKLFRVEDKYSIFHMTKEEIEDQNMDNIRVVSMLGYCSNCGNFSTESEIDDENVVCVICGYKRKYT